MLSSIASSCFAVIRKKQSSQDEEQHLDAGPMPAGSPRLVARSVHTHFSRDFSRDDVAVLRYRVGALSGSGAIVASGHPI